MINPKEEVKYSDPVAKVVGHMEITEEQKQRAEKLRKRVEKLMEERKKGKNT